MVRIKRRRKKKPILVFVGLMCLIGAAYAILSQTITLTSTTTVPSGTWDVKIDAPGTKVNTTYSKYVASGDMSIIPDGGGVSATVASKLTVPGARAVYDLKVKNTGSINAVLSSTPVTISNYEGTFAKAHITIYDPDNLGSTSEETFLSGLCNSDGESYHPNSTDAGSGGINNSTYNKLARGSGIKTYRILAWWNTSETTLPSTISELKHTITLNYEQNTTPSV